jgi:hypothetical protein
METPPFHIQAASLYSQLQEGASPRNALFTFSRFSMNHLLTNLWAMTGEATKSWQARDIIIPEFSLLDLCKQYS